MVLNAEGSGDCCLQLRVWGLRFIWFLVLRMYFLWPVLVTGWALLRQHRVSEAAVNTLRQAFGVFQYEKLCGWVFVHVTASFGFA